MLLSEQAEQLALVQIAFFSLAAQHRQHQRQSQRQQGAGRCFRHAALLRNLIGHIGCIAAQEIGQQAFAQIDQAAQIAAFGRLRHGTGERIAGGTGDQVKQA